MVLVLLAVFACCSLVGADTLDPIQHAALMKLFDDVGCNVTTCLRFAQTDDCIYNNSTLSSIPFPPSARVVCVQGNLTILELIRLDLTGTISAQIGKLTKLTILRAYGNALTGTIPPLDALTSLRQISLFRNNLSGSIPRVNLMSSLTSLRLFSNRLDGTIPPLPASLVQLELQSNLLRGAATIPTTLSSQLCAVQAPNDMNCLDCSTVAASVCNCSASLCLTTSQPSTTMLLPDSTMSPILHISTSTASITTTTTSNTPNPIVVDMLSPPIPLAAIVVGGVVGGVAVLLVIGVVVAVCVARRRRRVAPQRPPSPSPYALEDPFPERAPSPSQDPFERAPTPRQDRFKRAPFERASQQDPFERAPSWSQDPFERAPSPSQDAQSPDRSAESTSLTPRDMRGSEYGRLPPTRPVVLEELGYSNIPECIADVEPVDTVYDVGTIAPFDDSEE